MGCDIHSHIERKNASGTWERIDAYDPLGDRNYALFGWLANVRNYSDVPPISAARGFPEDASSEAKMAFERWAGDAHTPSWLLLSELLAFDYSQEVENRRVAMQICQGFWSGAETCSPGEGEVTTYREFLGDGFFRDLEAMKAAGAERVVFWFDN